MDSNSTHAGPPVKVAPEFGSWPTDGKQLDDINVIRTKFDDLLKIIELKTPAANGRYLALVKTKLEEACMFAVKAIAKPAN